MTLPFAGEGARATLAAENSFPLFLPFPQTISVLHSFFTSADEILIASSSAFKQSTL